jgi:hypothetical protein
MWRAVLHVRCADAARAPSPLLHARAIGVITRKTIDE